MTPPLVIILATLIYAAVHSLLATLESQSSRSPTLWSKVRIAGARFEERRLLHKFRETYAAYQENVPMFIPKITRKK